MYILIRRHQHRSRPVVVGQHAYGDSVVQHHVTRAVLFDGVMFSEDHFPRKPQRRFVHDRRRVRVAPGAGLVDRHDRGLPRLGGDH